MDAKWTAPRATGFMGAVVLALLASVPAASGGPPAHRSLRAIPTPPLPPGDGGVAGPGAYATGFEIGDGFAVGFIGGNGAPPWGAFAASMSQPRIEAANPASGDQHIRLVKDPIAAGNTFIGAFSPTLGAVPPGAATFTVDFSISATGGANYDVVLQAPSQSMLTARVRFDSLGNILVFDNPGTFPQFLDSGTDWAPGTYATLGVCLDPDTDSLEYYLDGALFYTSLTGLIGGTAIEQVIIAGNNNQVTDAGDFDNVDISPGLNCDSAAVADECEDCIAIAEGSVEGSTLNNTGASGDDSSCSLDDTIDQWYCYTASCTGLATASTCAAADFDTTISVFDACGGSELGCNDDGTDCPDFTSELTWPVVAGTTYYLRIAGFGDEAGNYTLSVSCDPEVSPPPNDDCADALTVTDGTTPFETIAGTTDGPPHLACESFGDDQVNQDIWYDYTATCTGELTVSTCNAANFDTRLAVYEGTACPVTEERLLGCNDDDAGCSAFTSRLTVPVVDGQSYKIRVGGFAEETGAGTLSVTCAPPGGPSNNACANALAVSEGVVAFTTIGATTDGSPSACPDLMFGDDQIHNDIWYTYTASCSGTLVLSTCNTANFDTRLAIYFGTGCVPSDATLLACNDDASGCAVFTSELFVTVAEGQSYTIRVGGFSAADFGSGTLDIGFAPRLMLSTISDGSGFEAGETVSVELRMEGACDNEVAGFQAFLAFDTASLAFQSGSYTDEPFGLHILEPIGADGAHIDLAAGILQFGGQMPTSDDALLTTLQFTALEQLCKADVWFRENEPPTRLTDDVGAEILPLLTFDSISCPPDVNGDGTIDVDDLIVVILAWGDPNCNADANGDGAVDVDDLILIILSWGPCPE